MKKRIVYTAGTWDLFHSGHLNILRLSKSLGDELIVGVSTDNLVKSYKNNFPILNYDQRAEIIKNIQFVDKVVKQEKLLDLEQIRSLNVDIITIGDDWKNKDNSNLNKLKTDNKIKLVFIPYTKELSTTKIKEKIKNGRN